MTDTTTLRVAPADATVVQVTAEQTATTATVDASTTVITTGAIGPRGAQGELGPTGLSAYEVALLEGFVGTEAAWLASLQGADGTPGASGGSYTHVQGVPASTWTIAHNLGYRPGGVLVFDSLDREVLGEVTHLDANTLTVTFTAGFSGTAYLS